MVRSLVIFALGLSVGMLWRVGHPYLAGIVFMIGNVYILWPHRPDSWRTR